MKLLPLNLSLINKLIFLLLLTKTGQAYCQTNLSSNEGQRAQSFTINVSTTNPSCGFANGIILVTVTGGTAPYLYSVNGYWQNTGYFPERSNGVCNIVVKDATGFTQSTTVVLSETIHRPNLTVSSFTGPTNCESINGTVSLTPSGGLPPYQYSLIYDRGYQSGNVFSNLATGRYLFYVKDANGCVGSTQPYDLTNSCPITIWGYNYSQVIPCNGTGHISIIGVAGGLSPYQYSIDGVNYQTDPNFTSLGEGIHIVYVKDAGGQVKTQAFQLFYNCELNITYVGVDAACLQNDGSLSLTAVNGSPPYTYTIDGVNYQSSNVFNGLASGNYTIGVKDASGTIRSRAATVFDRCPVISLSSTGEGCLLNDGTITASAIKGTAPYQYSIDGINFQSGNVFNGLSAGNYTITLKDALGFTDARSIIVDNACLIVTASGNDASCGNNNGSISATAGSGTAPYQFSIDGINFQSSNILTGLAAGTYTVTAKDINGHTGTTTLTISDIPAPQITINTTAASCSNNNGSIIISGTGGRVPYQFSIDGINYQSGNTFTNLASGSYTAYIKDGNNCISSQAVNVVLSCPTVTASVTNETCGSRNGVITAAGANGSPPYQYSIDGINFQGGNVFTGLGAGAYTITIKDALGATNTVTTTIANICPVVTVTVTDGLCGTANASIIASGTNGTAPYEYSIDGINFQANTGFTSLANGTYTITIRDANGLTNSTSATVQNFPGPSGVTATATAASCLNNDGGISIQASGGTIPLQYSINGTNYQASNVFNNIASSAYTVWVKDANGCQMSQAVTVPLQDNLNLVADNDAVICEGKNVTFQNVSNGSSFTWSSAIGLNNTTVLNPTASPVSTTKYYITATLGVCSKIDSLIVSVNPAPVANAGKDSVICYGKDIRLTGSGGVKYEWSPSTYLDNINIANPTITNPTSTITYSLYVTDNNGCRSLQPATVKITVTPPAKVFAGNDTAIVMNQPFTLRGADINNSGFTQYSWSPPYGLNNSMVQNPVVILDRDMRYTLTATTASGCKGVDGVNIKVYKGPEIYVPTAFTPNNDGLNDILKAIPVGIKEFRYFVVFNRWGQRVFYTNDANKGWNGKLSGTEQGNDSFTWIAEGIDDGGNKVVRKGTVVIVR